MLYKGNKVLIDNRYFERYHNDWSKKYFQPLIRKQYNCCIGTIACDGIVNKCLLSVDLEDTLYLCMYVYPMWFLRKPRNTDVIDIPIDYMQKLYIDTEEDLSARIDSIYT